MLPWLLVAQLLADTAVYASPRVRTLVSEAARLNRDAPRELVAYRATVESEIAIVARRATGVEGTISVEQLVSDVRWRRPGTFEQQVVGYRAQAIALQFATLGFLRQPWAVPTLYGNRITRLFGQDTSRVRRVRARRQPVLAIHPLAEDRERAYRFSGGDTVVAMRVGGRTLPIVRILVTPRSDMPPRTVAFRGELEVDATRHALVRMRGTFVTSAAPRSLAERVLAAGGLEAVAFVELENGEFDGRYWLPTYQRFEAQAAWTTTSDSRSVFRIVSRFREVRPNDTSLVTAPDSLIPQPYRLQVAPARELATFSAWPADLGTLSIPAHADDFDDIAPDAWRPSGAPTTRARVTRLADAFHVNRVEGLYMGWGVETRFRDRAPGLLVRANAGYAWHESAARGRVLVEWTRPAWTFTARAGRSLDLTNDFRTAFDSGSVVAALITVDNYDYVDRRLAAVGVARRVPRHGLVARAETGPARDASVVRHLARGLVRADSGFRENRGVQPGTWWRTWAAVELHPDVSAEFMRPGTGAMVLAEHGAGDLRFLRLEGRLTSRRNHGPLTVAARLDAGTVLGRDAPPQQLFELGRNQGLLGYDYKQFTGTTAALARGLAMWRLPVAEAPIPVGRWFLPGIAPAVAVGMQSAWTDVRATAAPAVAALWSPVRGPTVGIRTSVTVGLRIFGGALGVGMARPVDRAGSWRLRVDFGQLL